MIMSILSTLLEEYFEFRTTWEAVPRKQRSIEYLLECPTMLEAQVSKRRFDVPSSTSAALVAKGRSWQTQVLAHKWKSSTGSKKYGEVSKPKKAYSKIK